MADPHNQPSPLLEISDYHFCYPSYPGLESEPLFCGLDFSISRGEFWIVLGKPESGKTTLGRCLTGVYPGLCHAHTEGEIRIDGESVGSRSACDWVDRIGTVFQDPDEQIVTTRTDDEAAFTLESLGTEPDEIRSRMDHAFGQFGVAWKGARNPLSLSGGEKKRLLLAALEMQGADLWILDETLDELDREGQETLLGSLADLAGREQKGILLFVSKYREAFGNSGARLALLKEGRIVLRGEDHAPFRNLLREEGLLPPENPVPVNTGSSPAAGKRETVGAPLLEMKNLAFQYPDNPDFSLNIDRFLLHEGETLLLAGPNGCGKSTLARLVCGLIQADRGSLSFAGSPADRGLLNRSCGYLFQNPDYQLFLPTVAEELELGLKQSGLSRQERRSRVDRAVELFHLPGRDAPPSLMSFGARKRLQGAVYYLLEKGIYILDEADSGLNFTDYCTIVEQLKGKGSALIVITHNSDVSRIGGDRVCRMEGGRITGQESLI